MNTNEQANTASADMTAELVERLRVAMTIPVTILTVPTMQEIIDTLAAQEAELAGLRAALDAAPVAEVARIHVGDLGPHVIYTALPQGRRVRLVPIDTARQPCGGEV